jgi:hypothetical protein
MTTRKQVLAPLGTVLAVVGVVALVALLSPGGAKDSPQVLDLASGAGRAEAPTASGASTASGGYTLIGVLPAGTPDDAPAWSFDRGASASRLAAALHTTTEALQISRDPSQRWSSSPCGEDTAVSSAGGAVGCAVAPVQSPVPSDGKPLPAPPPPVSREVVVKAAAPVFAALGLESSKAVVETGPYGGSATLNPTVGGLETVGFLTSVHVDRTGAIQFASGWLGVPRRGDSYPLISARRAFDALPALLHPDVCRLPAVGEPGGCAAPPSPQISGARLGLLMQPLQDSGQALVPAWLCEVKGSSDLISQVAVEPRYLAPRRHASDQPLPANPVDPGAPVDPAPSKVTVGVDHARRGATPDQVVVQYGDNGCPWKNVQAEVKEDASTVFVALGADPKATGQACAELYRAVDVTVRLQGPLGDRTVVDASTAKAIPVS